MATETTENESAFHLRSLIGNAGSASNGEKLVNALLHMYPPGLTAAQERRVNVRLSKDLDFDDVAKIAGDGIDIRDAVVRGGELHDEDAWVTYAGYDAAGDTVKGTYPFPDHGSKSSDDHISQVDGLQNSEAARDHRHAQAKADAAAESTGDDSGDAAAVDPIGQYESLNADDVVAYLDEHPDRKDVIHALEVATKGDKARKTVMEWEPAPPPEGDKGDGSAGGDGA